MMNIHLANWSSNLGLSGNQISSMRDIDKMIFTNSEWQEFNCLALRNNECFANNYYFVAFKTVVQNLLNLNKSDGLLVVNLFLTTNESRNAEN